MIALLEIFDRTGEKSLPTSCKGSVYKGNPVQSCRDSKNGSPAAVVDVPKVVNMGKRMQLAAALPVVTQEKSR